MADKVTQDIKNQVSAYTQLRKEKYEMGRAEQAFKRDVLETVRVLKNEKDVMAGLNKTHRSLASGVEKAENKLSDLKERLEANKNLAVSYRQSIGGTRSALNKLTRTIRESGVATKGQAEQVKAYGGKLSELGERLKRVGKTNEEYEKSIKGVSEIFEKLSKESEEFDAGMEKLNDILKTQIGTWSDLESATDQYIKQEKDLYDLAVTNGKMKKADAEIEKRKLDTLKARLAIQKQLEETTPEMKREMGAKGRAEEAAKLLKLPKGGGRSGELLAAEMSSLKGKGGGALGTLLKGKGGIFGGIGAARELQESMKHYKMLKETTLGAGKGAGLLGGNIKMLGLAFEGLSKGNIFLLIAGMVGKLVKQLWDGMKELDAWLKTYNKTFMQIYGPTTMMKDVKGSVTSFTNAVFDMNRNLALGLKSEDIMGLFKALSAGGLTMTAVTGKFGGYDRAIRESFKLSKDFGVGLEEMGGMISDQMLEMRSSLDEVKKSFDAMSYDASIAGIQSQKFYQAVYTASSALGSYGNYIDDASNKLRKFVKTGALGFQDAAKTTEAMMGNTLKNMSIEQAAALVNMTGGIEKFRERLGEEIKTRETLVTETLPREMKALEKRKSENLISQEEYEAGQQDIAERTRKVNGELLDLEKARADKTGMAIFNHMEYFSKQYESIMSDLMVSWINQGKDIFGEAGPAFEQAAVAAGMSVETFRNLRKDVTASVASFKTLMDDPMIDAGFKSMSDDARAALLKAIDDAMVSGDWDTFVAGPGKALQALGVNLDSFEQQVEDNADNLKKYIKGGKEALTGVDLFKGVLKSKQQTGPGLRLKRNGITPDSDRLNKIVAATTSLEDYIGIGQENLKYVMASNDLTTMATAAAIGTAKGVFEILDLLTGVFRKRKDIKSEADYKEWKGTTKGVETKGKFLSARILEERLLKLEKEGKGESPVAEELKKQITNLRDAAKTNLEAAELSDRTADLNAEAVAEFTDSQTKIAKQKEYLGNLQETKDKLQEAYNQIVAGKAPADKFDDIKKQMDDVDEQITKYQETIKQLEEGLKLTLTIQDNKPLYETHKGKEERVTAEKKLDKAVPPGMDYEALSGGWKKLSKGDVVVDSDSLANGLGGNRGQFVQSLLNSMGGAGAGASTVTVPITLNVGSVNGDVDDMVNKIGPAVQQIFERMFYNKQKRAQ